MNEGMDGRTPNANKWIFTLLGFMNEFLHLGQSEMGKFIIETPKYENKHETK